MLPMKADCSSWKAAIRVLSEAPSLSYPMSFASQPFRTAPAADGREEIVRGHFSSALISGNDSWQPVLEQLGGERPERERKNINHQKFSWFNYGFFKKVISWSSSFFRPSHSIIDSGFSAFTYSKFFPEYLLCAHCVCVTQALPGLLWAVGSLPSLQYLCRRICTLTPVYTKARDRSHTLSLVSYWQRR